MRVRSERANPMSRSSLQFISAVVVVVSGLIVIGLAAPLALFLWETMKDPNLISYNVTYRVVNASEVEVNITLSYRGHVVLKDFTMNVYGHDVYFGDVVGGVYVKSMMVSPQKLIDNNVSVSFKVAGLYGFTVTSGG